MSQSEQEEVGTPRRGLQKTAAILGAAALVGLLAYTQVSSSHPSARAAAAESACDAYVTGSHPTTSGRSSSADAAVVDAYPTTAGNLGNWLLNFDPMGEGSFYHSIPRNEDVTACVIKGKWDLPNQSTLSSNVVSVENYSIVMIAPNGTATPLMWGQSNFVKESPPAM
jgi:hypothetical protein